MIRWRTHNFQPKKKLKITHERISDRFLKSLKTIVSFAHHSQYQPYLLWLNWLEVDRQVAKKWIWENFHAMIYHDFQTIFEFGTTHLKPKQYLERLKWLLEIKYNWWQAYRKRICLYKLKTKIEWNFIL